MSKPVLGILGGGQLGRMLALAAARLGVRSRVYDPAPDACAGDVAQLVCGSFEDESALARFCAGLDVVTIEFENVPVRAAEIAGQHVPLRPGLESIAIAQDRLHERGVLGRAGFATPVSEAIDSLQDLRDAVARREKPLLLKTRRLGYDGKGQAWVRSVADVEPAWARLGGHPLLLDQGVRFDREISLVAVRGSDGTTVHYPPIENVHREGILWTSRAPAPVDAKTLALARRQLEHMLDRLGYVGVIALEFFETGGLLLANEMAPRVHNSAHWTVDGARTSQFENHVRAVLGLPLGSTEARGWAGMLNLVGTAPPLERLLEDESVHVHLYGKEPRAGRKIGHVNVCEADERSREARMSALGAILEGSNAHVRGAG
ncbi:MAG: 5-(carboxyamino)imidazole ribonucleotide synthase [Phycisphaerales bacterium]|nr:5-(carboxyamino)imidazole ribonucleotide synthase [Phycisphaerales bacterium]